MNEVPNLVKISDILQIQIERKKRVEYSTSLSTQEKELQRKLAENDREDDMLCRRSYKLQSFINSSFLSKYNKKNRDQYIYELYKNYYDVRKCAIYMEIDYLQSCGIGTILKNLYQKLSICEKGHTQCTEQRQELLDRVGSIIRKIEIEKCKIREMDSLLSILEKYCLYTQPLQTEKRPYTKKNHREQII